MRQLECPFCVEFDGKTPAAEFQRLTGGVLQSRVVWETEDFVVFPDIAPIVRGHLLIASRRHVSSMGFLDVHELAELEATAKHIRAVLESAYGQTPIGFEHGAIDTFGRAGCCIDHAHFHFVPVNVELDRTLRELFPVRTIAELSSLREAVERFQPYLFFERSSGERFVFHPVQTISQVCRRLLCQELRLPERSDWVTAIDIDLVRQTMTDVEGLFDRGRS